MANSIKTKTRKPKPRLVINTTDDYMKKVKKQAEIKGFGSYAAYVIALINRDIEKGEIIRKRKN